VSGTVFFPGVQHTPEPFPHLRHRLVHARSKRLLGKRGKLELSCLSRILPGFSRILRTNWRQPNLTFLPYRQTLRRNPCTMKIGQRTDGTRGLSAASSADLLSKV
jgi:hypothetical protein